MSTLFNGPVVISHISTVAHTVPILPLRVVKVKDSGIISSILSCFCDKQWRRFLQISDILICLIKASCLLVVRGHFIEF